LSVKNHPKSGRKPHFLKRGTVKISFGEAFFRKRTRDIVGGDLRKFIEGEGRIHRIGGGKSKKTATQGNPPKQQVETKKR